MLTVGGRRAINFKTMIYEPSWFYEGGFQFKTHYFGPKARRTARMHAGRGTGGGM
jgi:hypothetical protein